jgi:hypothetical protein|tara:strand:+ start:713 stop:1516 length:804 start_codon:yes stop_codon:yes gene_type:complete
MRYLLSLLLVLIFQGCNKPDDSSLASENTAEDFYIETCSTFAEISFSSYIIQNNNWGEDNFPGEQCIFLSGPDTLFGWSWNYPANDSEYKYPEIIAGRKPWGTDSNFPLLPIRISNIKNFSTSYDVTTESAGKNNLAYDIWVNGVDNSQMISGDNIRAEIMIWVDDNGLCCWGDKQGTVMISNSEFDVYKTELSHIPGDNYYILFYSEESIYKKTLDIAGFIDYAVEKGWIHSSNFISSIEFGNEVVSGTGTTEIREYSVTVEVNPI